MPGFHFLICTKFNEILQSQACPLRSFQQKYFYGVPRIKKGNKNAARPCVWTQG